MCLVTCDDTYGICRDSHFQEGFVIIIREWLGERGGSYRKSAMFNVIKKGTDLVFIKLELRSGQDLFVFRQDAGVKRKSQLTGRNHADNFPARSERRQKSGNKHIGIEDNIHCARAR